MTPFRTILTATCVSLAIGIGLSACTPLASRNGYLVVDANPKDVKPGEDTRTSVLSRLGSPSAMSTFDSQTWYYVSQTQARVTYHAPQITSRQVVAISFDKASEKVTEVKTLGLRDGKVVAINGRETPTRGRELTIVEQLLGTVGRQMLPIDQSQTVPGGRRPD